MNEEELYNKLSELIVLRNQKDFDFIRGNEILNNLKSLPKEERKIYDVEIGLSPKLLKIAIQFLKTNGYDIKKFSEYLDEMDANLRHFFHYIEDENVPSKLSDKFNEDEYGRSLNVMQHRKHYEDDVFPNEINNPRNIFNNNKTQFEDLIFSLGVIGIQKLKKSLSCIHIIKIPELEAEIVCNKPLQLFFNDLKSTIDELYSSSEYVNSNYNPKENFEDEPIPDIRYQNGRLKSHNFPVKKIGSDERTKAPTYKNPPLSVSDHIETKDIGLLSGKFLLKW